MPQTEPRIGTLYSCEEQSKMHGGNPQPTLPESNGEVTLIRFRLDKNPNGPHIIDHGEQRRLRERIEMLAHQSEPLPVYKYVRSAAWEYLGRYRVQDISDDSRLAAERSKVCRRPIKYVIRLEKAS
jgi:hypothetical protein